MAGPLQPIPGYNPQANGGGLPSLHPLVNALLNVATLGEHDNPGSLAAYGKSVAQGFDPRTPAGAFNLATILVPGGPKGGATFQQAKFLQAINETSHGNTPAQGWGDLSFSRDDPGVQGLMRHLGAPPMRYVARNQAQARAPWVALDPRTFQHIRGGSGGRRMSDAFAGDLRIGDLAHHQSLVKTLMQKNAIQRRN